MFQRPPTPLRAVRGPDPTAGLVEAFAQIDEYKRKERKRY
jgi:hypothetical protein